MYSMSTCTDSFGHVLEVTGQARRVSLRALEGGREVNREVAVGK